MLSIRTLETSRSIHQTLSETPQGPWADQSENAGLTHRSAKSNLAGVCSEILVAHSSVQLVKMNKRRLVKKVLPEHRK